MPKRSTSHSRTRQALLARQAELQHQAAKSPIEPEADLQEVHDFKDLASDESQSIVDDVASAHAADELRQIAVALGRIAAHVYGSCQDCGQPIEKQRLRALPTAARCTDCQRVHEVRKAVGP